MCPAIVGAACAEGHDADPVVSRMIARKNNLGMSSERNSAPQRLVSWFTCVTSACLVLDGVNRHTADCTPEFVGAPAPIDETL